MSGDDIWYASFTTYKSRGQSPSRTIISFYSSREKAEEFLCSHMVDVLLYTDVIVEDEDEHNYDVLSQMLHIYMEENPCDKYQWELTNATKRVDEHDK
jgi:hypothetical protein